MPLAIARRDNRRARIHPRQELQRDIVAAVVTGLGHIGHEDCFVPLICLQERMLRTLVQVPVGTRACP